MACSISMHTTVVRPAAILDCEDFILALVLPFHSQFGHVGRPEFVAVARRLTDRIILHCN